MQKCHCCLVQSLGKYSLRSTLTAVQSTVELMIVGMKTGLAGKCSEMPSSETGNKRVKS